MNTVPNDSSIKEKYILNKQDLKRFLSVESKNYNKKSFIIPLICLREQDYLWKYNFLLRKTEYHVNVGNKLFSNIYKLILKNYQLKHKIYIPINTFDIGLKIMHLGPILVNKNVKGGKNISLHINTGIVAGGSNNKSPKLDDGVVLGIGSVILGDTFLAKNIAVGANAVVNKSFYEENVSVAGVPAKKVSSTGRLSWGK